MLPRNAVAVTLISLAMGAACGGPEEKPLGPEEGLASDTRALLVQKTVFGNQMWQDTGLNVKVSDRVVPTCASGLNYPWAGHGGFSCGGDPTNFWSQSLVPSCPFGSLVGKIGAGPPFCASNLATNQSGRLYLAFNDGVNFADNSGSWTVNVGLGRPWIGMPFTGTFGSSAAPPGTHTVYDSQVAQWATDLYAPPGTPVLFKSASWVTGEVSYIADTTCPTGEIVGKTIYIELYNKANGVTNRIGRAIYTHVASVSVGYGTIANGAKLGVTSKFTRVPGCYDVQLDSQVHVHFELGTHADQARTSNYACWRPANATAVSLGGVIGYYGSTGLTSKQRCSAEP